MYAWHCNVTECLLAALLFSAALAASEKLMDWHIRILYWYIIGRQDDREPRSLAGPWL